MDSTKVTNMHEAKEGNMSEVIREAKETVRSWRDWKFLELITKAYKY